VSIPQWLLTNRDLLDEGLEKLRSTEKWVVVLVRIPEQKDQIPRYWHTSLLRFATARHMRIPSVCLSAYFIAADAVTAMFESFRDDKQLRTVEIGFQYEIFSHGQTGEDPSPPDCHFLFLKLLKRVFTGLTEVVVQVNKEQCLPFAENWDGHFHATITEHVYEEIPPRIREILGEGMMQRLVGCDEAFDFETRRLTFKRK
jgi:hypothetical protein